MGNSCDKLKSPSLSYYQKYMFWGPINVKKSNFSICYFGKRKMLYRKMGQKAAWQIIKDLHWKVVLYISERFTDEDS